MISEYQEAYIKRLEEYRHTIYHEYGNKHTICLDALKDQPQLHINELLLDEWCKRCDDICGEVDFEIVVMIRLLYLLHQRSVEAFESLTLLPASLTAGELKQLKELLLYSYRIVLKIEKSLCIFPFWPHEGTRRTNADKLVFWSENHILLLLGSAYLFKQWIDLRTASIDWISYICNDQQLPAEAPPNSFINELEELLLRIYIDAHVNQFSGLYECTSHVYLPYSLCALFNLIDFSNEENIIEKQSISQQAILFANIIVQQLMLCTASNNGVANLSASARAFPRTRQRTHFHNINQLIKLMVGSSTDNWSTMFLTNFLLTSKFIPCNTSFDMLHMNGFMQFPINHPANETRRIYSIARNCINRNASIVSDIDLIPFYWSAGLIVHPDFVKDTMAYQRLHGMEKNVHLKPLAYLQKLLPTEWILQSYSHFSCGQSYLGNNGIVLNVYKKTLKGLIMSSFENFSPGICGFQQLPWMVNLNGVGIWSQAGKLSEGLLGFSITNTHNPMVTQRDHILIAAYVTPKTIRNSVIVGNIFASDVKLFWPEQFFEVSGNSVDSLGVRFNGQSVPSALGLRMKWNALDWWFGNRNGAFIGITCTAATVVHTHPIKEAAIEVAGRCESIPRRVCNAHEHAWIVVTGDEDSYDQSFHAFIDYCCHLEITDTLQRPRFLVPSIMQPREDRKWIYNVAVHDPTSGSNVSIAYERE